MKRGAVKRKQAPKASRDDDEGDDGSDEEAVEDEVEVVDAAAASEDEADKDDAGAAEKEAKDSDEDGDDDDEEVSAAKRRMSKLSLKKSQKKAGSKKKAATTKGRAKPGERKRGARQSDATTGAEEKKPIRLSAATLKTKMSPGMLQNPMARRKIWGNLMEMMVRRGYEWHADKAPPTDFEQLLPNNKGVLGTFHMHAVDVSTKDERLKREPVHVVFCSKAGEPTLKSLHYPSRHIIVVSDSLTGRARAALQALPVKRPPTAASPREPREPDTKLDQKHEPSGGAVVGASAPGDALTLKEVFVEAFVSSFFMFDLLKQRYLKVVQFTQLNKGQLEHVFDVFERKGDLTHFPRMVEADPVARYLRLEPGSVIQQTRLSTAAAIHNAYRVVV